MKMLLKSGGTGLVAASPRCPEIPTVAPVSCSERVFTITWCTWAWEKSSLVKEFSLVVNSPAPEPTLCMLAPEFTSQLSEFFAGFAWFYPAARTQTALEEGSWGRRSSLTCWQLVPAFGWAAPASLRDDTREVLLIFSTISVVWSHFYKLVLIEQRKI